MLRIVGDDEVVKAWDERFVRRFTMTAIRTPFRTGMLEGNNTAGNPGPNTTGDPWVARRFYKAWKLPMPDIESFERENGQLIDVHEFHATLECLCVTAPSSYEEHRLRGLAVAHQVDGVILKHLKICPRCEQNTQEGWVQWEEVKPKCYRLTNEALGESHNVISVGYT
jgi:hypothetical protein